MDNKKLMGFLAPLFLGLLLAAMDVAALDLAQAKSSGLVGEQMNGFLGLVKPDAPADVKALVLDINAQRQVEYQRIAAKNGASAEDVARLTAQKVIGQTASGQFVETASGWQKR
ncbi:MAG: YdbL family protein [Methylovulum sp.]|nr:YdbL family protein [Methylovulum sp.]